MDRFANSPPVFGRAGSFSIMRSRDSVAAMATTAIFYQSLTIAIDKGLLFPAGDFVSSQATLRQRVCLPQRKVLF